MLQLEALHAGYAATPVLFGIDLAVEPGQAVALLGRNGMGKTTTIRTIVGALRPSAGSIRFAGHRLDGASSHAICRLGVGYVPEGRRIFRHLTVHEQLTAFMAPARHGPAWRPDDIYELFPGLVPRRTSPGGLLSGGEQQMLAIGRALVTQPSLLILDEATEGLAPLVRNQIWRVLAELKRRSLSILVVDKNPVDVLGVADRAYVLERGRVSWSGPGRTLLDDPALQARLLSV